MTWAIIFVKQQLGNLVITSQVLPFYYNNQPLFINLSIYVYGLMKLYVSFYPMAWWNIGLNQGKKTWHPKKIILLKLKIYNFSFSIRCFNIMHFTPKKIFCKFFSELTYPWTLFNCVDSSWCYCNQSHKRVCTTSNSLYSI